MNPLTYQDLTLKAKLVDSESLEKKLVSLGATFVGTDFQTDYYFRIQKGKLKFRKGTIENLITHYERVLIGGLEKTIVYRYDLNPTEEQLAQLFQLEQIGIIKKVRKIFFFNHIKIHVDQFENGDQFLEIEVMDKEGQSTFDHLKKQCSEIQIKLGISDNDLIPTGYLP